MQLIADTAACKHVNRSNGQTLIPKPPEEPIMEGCYLLRLKPVCEITSVDTLQYSSTVAVLQYMYPTLSCNWQLGSGERLKCKMHRDTLHGWLRYVRKAEMCTVAFVPVLCS